MRYDCEECGRKLPAGEYSSRECRNCNPYTLVVSLEAQRYSDSGSHRLAVRTAGKKGYMPWGCYGTAYSGLSMTPWTLEVSTGKVTLCGEELSVDFESGYEGPSYRLAQAKLRKVARVDRAINSVDWAPDEASLFGARVAAFAAAVGAVTVFLKGREYGGNRWDSSEWVEIDPGGVEDFIARYARYVLSRHGQEAQNPVEFLRAPVPA